MSTKKKPTRSDEEPNAVDSTPGGVSPIAEQAAGASRKFRILLVDDHPVVLGGSKMMIETQPDLTVCGAAATVQEALALIEREHPDIVVTDLTMPGRSGIELIKDLVAVHPETKVLVFSMHDELLYAERCLRAGAKGYVMKDAPSDSMLTAIRTIIGGGVWVSPRLNAKIIGMFTGATPRGSSSPVEKLSDREFDVYRLFGEGQTTKEIAASLNLSPKTVAVHRDNIRAKLGLRTTAELLRYAARWVETQETEQAE
jgi:DNA-binding NarL/FixJ family response regulator